MDDKTEVIRQKIEDTRTSLAEPDPQDDNPLPDGASKLVDDEQRAVRTPGSSA